MRSIKMLGFAAVAAVLAMAFIGASSAMAGSTLLCLKNTASQTPTLAECEPPSIVHYVNVNDSGQIAKAKLLAVGFPTIECELLVLGTVTDRDLVTNGPVRIAVANTGVVYTNCNNKCNVIANNGGTLLVLRTAVELATVVGDGFARFNVDCFGLFDCDYNSANLTGHGLGPTVAGTGGKGHTTYNDAAVNLEQDLFSPFGSCPSVSKLDALLRAVVPVYIRA